jgi:hypothetical protein
MYENIFSVMDLIQYALVAACGFALYREGFKRGARQVLEKLAEMGVVQLQQPEQDEENS